MSGFVLTDENYYSREADILYMSCSQFQSFQTCEAAMEKVIPENGEDRIVP